MAADRDPKKARTSGTDLTGVSAGASGLDPGEKAEIVGKAESLLRPLLRDPSKAESTAAELIAVSEQYSGPMPHPRHFAAYEDAVPGSGREILAMAVREQGHRHRTQLLELIYPYAGLALGFVAFGFCIAGAVVLALHDHDVVAGLLLGVPVLGVIGWFINARVSASSPEPPASPSAGRPQRRR